MDKFSFLNAAHSQLIEDLYQQYLKYPDSLEPSWKAFFQDLILRWRTMAMKFREITTLQLLLRVQCNWQIMLQLTDKFRMKFKRNLRC
ncbi:hypothetical protein LDL59_06640 [Kaistella anthropi]|nr:hypothetical protein [Kaistella anthropi]